MGDVLALTGLTHTVALDGLGEDDGWLQKVCGRLRVGSVDLVHIVAATIERPDLIIGPVADHRGQFGVFAEEVLADVGAVLRFEVLVLAVDALLHALEEDAAGISGNELVPAGAPDDFEHVPARAAENALELLNDLAVAANGPVQALKIAVDDKNQVVEVLPPRQ